MKTIKNAITAVTIWVAAVASPAIAQEKLTHEQIAQICLNPDFAQKTGYSKECEIIMDGITFNRGLAWWIGALVTLLTGAGVFVARRRKNKPDNNNQEVSEESFFQDTEQHDVAIGNVVGPIYPDLRGTAPEHDIMDSKFDSPTGTSVVEPVKDFASGFDLDLDSNHTITDLVPKDTTAPTILSEASSGMKVIIEDSQEISEGTLIDTAIKSIETALKSAELSGDFVFTKEALSSRQLQFKIGDRDIQLTVTPVGSITAHINNTPYNNGNPISPSDLSYILSPSE